MHPIGKDTSRECTEGTTYFPLHEIQAAPASSHYQQSKHLKHLDQHLVLVLNADYQVRKSYFLTITLLWLVYFNF